MCHRTTLSKPRKNTIASVALVAYNHPSSTSRRVMPTEIKNAESSKNQSESRSIPTHDDASKPDQTCLRKAAPEDKSVIISEEKDWKPELTVMTDYDGYFEHYVEVLIEQKATSGHPFKINKIVVDSGPWRPYDVHIEQRGETLHIDFYSVCRFRGGPDADEMILRAL